MLYFINSSNFIVWLPLVLEILGNMCFAIVCFPGCDVINYNNNLIFQIKLCTWPKRQDKNLNIWVQKNFKVKQKTLFIIFKGLSVTKYYVRPKTAPLHILLIDRILKNRATQGLIYIFLNYYQCFPRFSQKIKKYFCILKSTSSVDINKVYLQV